MSPLRASPNINLVGNYYSLILSLNQMNTCPSCYPFGEVKNVVIPEPHVSEDTNNFLAPVNHVSDVKVNDGGSNTVTVMHSRGESGVTKTRTVRIDSNGVAADIVVIKKGERERPGFFRRFIPSLFTNCVRDCRRE